MGRINRYRDIKDPQLNYFIAENLRDHKDRIKQKQVVMTTEGLNIVTSTNSIDGVTCEDIRTGKEITPESTKTTADNEIRSQEAPRKNIKEQLMLLFNKNLESLKSKPLELRHNTTRINKKLDEKVISTINDICGEALQSLSNIDYWDINYIIYCAAITCKEFNNDVISSSQKPTNERNQTPKWITQLEASNTNTRQNIAQLGVVLKCKQKNKFTEHQRNLFEKFRKKFGNTRASTLSYKLTMLKQDLKSKSGRLKYEKRLASRKSLNKKFEQVQNTFTAQ